MWVAELSIEDIQHDTGSGVLVTFTSIQPLLDAGVSSEGLACRRYAKSGDKHTYHAVIANGARHIPIKGNVLVGVEASYRGCIISLLRILSSISSVIEVEVVQAARMGPNRFSLTFKSINPFLEIDIQHERLRIDATGAVTRTVAVTSGTNVPIGPVLVAVSNAVDILYMAPALKMSDKNTIKKTNSTHSTRNTSTPTAKNTQDAHPEPNTESTPVTRVPKTALNISPFGYTSSSSSISASSVFGFATRTKTSTVASSSNSELPPPTVVSKKRSAPDTIPAEVTSTKKNMTEADVAAIDKAQ